MQDAFLSVNQRKYLAIALDHTRLKSLLLNRFPSLRQASRENRRALHLLKDLNAVMMRKCGTLEEEWGGNIRTDQVSSGGASFQPAHTNRAPITEQRPLREGGREVYVSMCQFTTSLSVCWLWQDSLHYKFA